MQISSFNWVRTAVTKQMDENKIKAQIIDHENPSNENEGCIYI